MTDDTLARRAASTPQAVAAISFAHAHALLSLALAGAARQQMQLAEHLLVLARDGEAKERRRCGRSASSALGQRPASDAGWLPSVTTALYRAQAEQGR